MEIIGDKVCDEEWELLNKWLNHWSKTRTQQQDESRNRTGSTEEPRDPPSSTTATEAGARAETVRFTADPYMEWASLAAFLRPLLNETRNPQQMYIGELEQVLQVTERLGLGFTQPTARQ